MRTIELYEAAERLEAIKADIQNGSNFNGVVYGENKGKSWVSIYVFIDGKRRAIKDVQKEDMQKIKNEVSEFFSEKSEKTNFGNYGVGCISTKEAAYSRGYDAIED